MNPGDFVITPSWTWHHHGHEGKGPMVWLDGLDIPITHFFGSTFREDHAADEAVITRPAGDAPAQRLAELARLQPSVRTHPRGAARVDEGRRTRCAPGPPDALREFDRASQEKLGLWREQRC